MSQLTTFVLWPAEFWGFGRVSVSKYQSNEFRPASLDMWVSVYLKLFLLLIFRSVLISFLIFYRFWLWIFLCGKCICYFLL